MCVPIRYDIPYWLTNCLYEDNVPAVGMEDCWCSDRDQYMWKFCDFVDPWPCSELWLLCGTDGPEGSDMLPRSGTAPFHTGTADKETWWGDGVHKHEKERYIKIFARQCKISFNSWSLGCFLYQLSNLSEINYNYLLWDDGTKNYKFYLTEKFLLPAHNQLLFIIIWWESNRNVKLLKYSLK